MTFIFKADNAQAFTNYWNQYIHENITVSHRYLLLKLEYFLLYSRWLVCDQSFVVVEDNKCIGICFLPFESKDNIMTISIASGYTMSPLANNKRVEREIFKKINELSDTNNIQKIMFYIDPFTIKDKENFNNLLAYNFIDTSTTDCYIDLTQDESKLWSNLRKSYKALINNILKDQEYEIIYIDQKNINEKYYSSYVDLHYACSGTKTRDEKTFENQYYAILDNNATLIGLKYKDSFIGMSYISHFKEFSSYSSGVDDPLYDNKKIPIYHVLLWSAIKYLKKRNYKKFILNQPCGYDRVSGFGNYLTNKQINISHFKQGMGAEMIPFFRGIKYFNKELAYNDIKIFNEKLLETEEIYDLQDKNTI